MVNYYVNLTSIDYFYSYIFNFLFIETANYLYTAYRSFLTKAIPAHKELYLEKQNRLKKNFNDLECVEQLHVCFLIKLIKNEIGKFSFLFYLLKY